MMTPKIGRKLKKKIETNKFKDLKLRKSDNTLQFKIFVEKRLSSGKLLGGNLVAYTLQKQKAGTDSSDFYMDFYLTVVFDGIATAINFRWKLNKIDEVEKFTKILERFKSLTFRNE